MQGAIPEGVFPIDEVLDERGAPPRLRQPRQVRDLIGEREFFIGNLFVRIHFIIEMIWWIDLAPWEFESPFPGSLMSTFLVMGDLLMTDH